MIESNDKTDSHSIIFSLQQLLNNKQIQFIQEKNRRINLENKCELLENECELLKNECSFLRGELENVKQMINKNNKKNDTIYSIMMHYNIYLYGFMVLVVIYLLIKSTF